MDEYRVHGRRFPWRATKNPYRILVSELMLQQTQVARVLRYYRPFLRAFPNFEALTRAPFREVLAAWQGLGYNRRALALKSIAEKVCCEYGGKLPRNPIILETFPGIGSATAGAIATFAFNMHAPFVETNIRRACLHEFFKHKKKVSDKVILALLREFTFIRDRRTWYYALMDYGAMIGRGRENPNTRSAHYRRQAPFKGSRRELRGEIVRALLLKRNIPLSSLWRRSERKKKRVLDAIRSLERDRFLSVRGARVELRN